MSYPALAALGATSAATTSDVVRELVSRGFTSTPPPATSIPPPATTAPPPATTAPAVTISKRQAIVAGADKALRFYNLALRCSKSGGCGVSNFSTIVNLGVQYANLYRRADRIYGLGRLGSPEDIQYFDVGGELNSRGYRQETLPSTYVPPSATTAPPPATTVPSVTKAQAIDAAADKMLAFYGHALRCSGSICYLSGWNTIVKNTLTYANYFISRGRLYGLGRLGADEPLGPPAPSEPWYVTYGPLILQSVGDVINNLGVFLQARDIKAAIARANVPMPATKADLEALMVQLKQLAPDRAREIEAGTRDAFAGAGMMGMPSWVLPAAVAGGAVLLMTAMRK